MKRMLKPEADYEAPTKTTIEYLTMSWETNKTITGVPIDYDTIEKVMIVDLGNGYYGQLPANEITIEELKCINGMSIPVQINLIVQSRVIRVKITKIENGEIFLSRRKNLMEICEYFKSEKKVKVSALVTETTNFGVFCDVGDGMIALCHYSEMSRARIYPKNFLKIGERVNVIVYPNKNSENKLNCSIKRASKINYSEIKEGAIINVKIGQPIYDEEGVLTGYFVEITPSISGIADIQFSKEKSKHFKNGDVAKAYVRSVRERSYKVKLTLR